MTCDFLEVPFQLIDRSLAFCGSHEHGQTGFCDTCLVPRECIPPHSVRSVTCGSWSTHVDYTNDHFTVLGVTPESGSPVFEFLARRLPNRVGAIHIGDSFQLSVKLDGTLTVTGDCGFGDVRVRKAFAKFQFAAVITTDSTVLVKFVDSGRIESMTPHEPPHSVVPLGADGFAILAETGTLFCHPRDDDPFVIEKVVSVASGRSRTVILAADGRLYEVVRGKKRQIGGVAGLPVKVFAGAAHFGCITFDGSAFCWGVGTHGQLGNGSFFNTEQPRQVVRPPGKRIIDADAGERHTVFVLVPENQFAMVLPGIMMQEPIPASFAASCAIPHGMQPHEVDMKF
jgi:hypothetical protein